MLMTHVDLIEKLLKYVCCSAVMSCCRATSSASGCLSSVLEALGREGREPRDEGLILIDTIRQNGISRRASFDF